MLTRYTKKCIKVHHAICLTNRMIQKQAQQIILLCLFTYRGAFCQSVIRNSRFALSDVALPTASGERPRSSAIFAAT